MTNILQKLLIACCGISLTACATTSSVTGPSSQMLAPGSNSLNDKSSKQDLLELHNIAQETNAEIQKVFPKQKEAKITLWATDLENLVDGTFTQTFGDKLSPAPSLKMYAYFKNTGVSLIDGAHVRPCQGMEEGSGQFWVLRTYLSDLDETVHRKVKGFYPNGESGSIQAEIDKGTRSMTDTFKLSAKLTDCRTGRIIHSAENSFSKTTSGKDNSIYLFGKHLGLFYRSTEFHDPGLNRTKDLALDVFLSSVAKKMVGAPDTVLQASAVSNSKNSTKS